MRGFKKILHDFSESTSAHGIPHVGAAKDAAMRLFWTVIVLGAMGMLGYSIFLLLQNYFSYPITVQTELNNNPRVFPAVTICNVNPYRRTELTKNNSIIKDNSFKKKFERHATTSPEGKTTFDKIKDYKLGAGLAEDTANLYYITANVDLENKLKSGHLLGDLFSETGGSNSPLSVLFNDEPVYRSDFHQWWHPLYGNCYTFNHNGKYTADKPGLKYGLTANLNVQTDEYLSTSLTSGVRVVVHDQSTEPFPESFGYTVPPGTLTAIGLRYVTAEKLSEPYGHCTKNPSEVEHYFYRNDYSMEGCYKSCQQNNVIEKCGCASPYLPLPDQSNARYCEAKHPVLTDKNVRCVREAEKVSSENCNCPAPCKSSTYLATLSSGRYPVPGAEPDCDTLSADRPQDVDMVLAAVGQAGNAISGALEPLTAVVNAIGDLTMGGIGQDLGVKLDLTSIFKAPLDEIKSLLQRFEYMKCAKDMSENTMILQIYLEELSYQRYYEEPAYGVIDLVSDFGGQLGLWLGFSIITYIEVMLLGVTIIAFVFRGCKNREEDDADDRVRPLEVDYYRSQKIQPYPPPHQPPAPPLSSRPGSVMYEKCTTYSEMIPPPVAYTDG